MAYGSQVNSEINNIVNILNNLDAGSSKWDIVSILNATSVPLIVDNSSGSQDVADFKVNGSTKVSVGSAGLLTAAAGATVSGAPLTMSGQTIAMGSNKITGLANGTASADAVAFGQISGQRILQVVTNTATAIATTTSSTYSATNLTVTITPTGTTTKMIILAVGPGNCNSTSHAVLFGLSGTTNGQLQGSTKFLTEIWHLGNIEVPVSVCYVDSPGTVAAQTYSLTFKNDDNATSVTFGDTNNIQTMVVVEVG